MANRISNRASFDVCRLDLRLGYKCHPRFLVVLEYAEMTRLFRESSSWPIDVQAERYKPFAEIIRDAQNVR